MNTDLAQAWRGPLEDLYLRIRANTDRQIREALSQGRLQDLGRPISQGAADTTFGIDVGPEAVIREWFEEHAERGPLSLFSEDAGWLHSGTAEFDHGGPRIIVDPIDGTRNLMHDLRSAWTVISFCGPGPEQPRFRDLMAGMVAELPDSRTHRARRFWGVRGGGCWLAHEDLLQRQVEEPQRLRVDDQARVDHGYFVFFSYHPSQRPPIARFAADFFERLAAHEGADLNHCYDDQYISSGGQLALLSQGTYRLVVDVRGHLGIAAPKTKAYDMAGAALCAQEAGAVVTAPNGEPLDFPFDATTAVNFAAFANPQSAARLGPHLRAAWQAHVSVLRA